MTDIVNIGIIGTGRIGQIHAHNLCSSIQKDTELAVTGRDSRIPVVMALAAQRSLQTHMPVRIDHG